MSPEFTNAAKFAFHRARAAAQAMGHFLIRVAFHLPLGQLAQLIIVE